MQASRGEPRFSLSKALGYEADVMTMQTSFATADSFSRRSMLRAGAYAGLGLAAASASPLLHAAYAQGSDPRAQWPAIAALIDRYVSGRQVANMVAALGWGEAQPEVIARGTLSFESSAPAGIDTLYRIYSMTKPVTGMAAMMLIDEGRLGLDQPLAEILPAYAEMQVQKRYDGPITPDNLEPAVRPITIRHLLTHTSGLGYSIIQSGPIAEAYRRNGLDPGSVSRLAIVPIFNGPKAPSLAAFADRLATLPLVRQPGTRWGYSMSLDLLGRVIEVVSGEAFDAFLQTRIFDPCGMTSTWFQVPPGEAQRLATNYFSLAGVPLPIDMGVNSIFLDKPAFPFGGAGLVSSARDYDRFLQMLAGYGMIDGRRVMSEDAVRLGTSDLMPDTVAANAGFREGFGFGAAGLVGKGEAEGLYGWFGAAGTAGLVNMRHGLRQTLMTQIVGAAVEQIQEQFPRAVAEDAAAMRPSA